MQGVSGQVATTICTRATSPTGHSHVLIEGGINDFVLSLPPEGIIAAYASALEVLELTGQQVRIVGVTRVDPAALSPDYQFLNNTAIDAVNNRLIDLCATYANCRPLTAAMQMSVAGHTVDGIHKNGGGYAAWASAMTAEM
jgi:lysophospholipase L1-like esterase